MKVAEIFAELGLKLTGDSKANLSEFEKTLLGIANAAKEAATALAALSKAQVPKGFKMAAVPQQGTPAAVVAAPATPGMPTATATAQPPASGQQPGGKPLPNSVMQGLKSLGMLGLKVLGIGTIVLALKSLISTLGRWLKASVAATVSTELFTRQTGTSRKTLKEWELASTKAGLAEGEASQAFKTFTKKWQHMRLTGEGAGPFGFLGIDPSAGPEKVFQAFRDKTKNMSNETATALGELLGFSDDFAAWLHSLKGDIPRLSDAVLLSDKEQAAVVSLNSSWVDLTATMDRLRDKIVADFAPDLKSVLDMLTTAANVFTALKPLREAMMGNPLGAFQSLNSPPRVSTGSPTINNSLFVDLHGIKDPAAVQKALTDQWDKFANRMTGRAYYQTPPSNLAAQPQ